MSEALPGVWNGARPLLRRQVMAREQLAIGQLGIVAATEALLSPTDWCFDESEHKIVVHLGGNLHHLHCEFSSGPSGKTLPRPGDIWIIPAGCRYAALAQGEQAHYVEFTVPTAALADAEMQARVGYRDDFLLGAASRLFALTGRRDDSISMMAAHAIAGAVSAHLLDRFGRKPPPNKQRALSARQKSVLIEAIRDQLEAEHSLASLAALVDMDVRRFTSAFQTAFGLTPWQYVLAARLEHAADLLRTTDRSVTDIALDTGFATSSHFATAFARKFGAPPTRYRALAGVAARRR